MSAEEVGDFYKEKIAVKEKSHGTKLWIELWSCLLLCIVVLLGIVVMKPQLLRQTDEASANAGDPHAAAAGEGDAETAAKTEAVSDKEEAPSAGAAALDENEASAVHASENPASGDGQNASSDASEAAEEEDGSIRLLFAGDVYPSEYVLDAYQAAGGIGGVVSESYRKDMAAADLFMANEEFPFSTRGTPAPDKQYTFRVNPEKATMLSEMSIDLVTLANNHALDYGRDALLDSLDTLDDAGILHVGAGKDLESARKPVYVTLKGRKLAFIGATRVMPEADWAADSDRPGMLSAYDGGDRLCTVIKEAKQQADFVIVYMHWGIERAEEPNDVQTSLAHRIVDAGADLVIGAHPHVLQGLEYYNGVPIAYSLGNFVFGSKIPSTALLSVELDTDNALTLRLLPGTSAGGYTRKLEDADEIRAFAEKMTNLSKNAVVNTDGTVQMP